MVGMRLRLRCTEFSQVVLYSDTSCASGTERSSTGLQTRTLCPSSCTWRSVPWTCTSAWRTFIDGSPKNAPTLDVAGRW